MTQATAEDLHARIRELQEKLKEAELANEALLAENSNKTKSLHRLSIKDVRGRATSSPVAEEAEKKTMVLETQLEEAAKRMERSELDHVHQTQQLEDKVVILQSQMMESTQAMEKRLKSEQEEKRGLQKQLDSLEAEMAATRDNKAREILMRNPEFLDSLADAKEISLKLNRVLNERSSHNSVESYVDQISRESLWFLFAVLKSEECASVQRELAQWQKIVKKLGEDKEIAEEKFQETLLNSTSNKFHTAQNVSLEAETERQNELDSARQALAQIRKRTLESEALRNQISVVVKENERLVTELEACIKNKTKAEKAALDSQIKLEIYMERDAEKNGTQFY